MGFRRRALAALHSELADSLPYAPRLDLWYAGCVASGTMPAGYEGASIEQICRAEGWGIYSLTSSTLSLFAFDEGMALQCLGLFTTPERGYRLAFDNDARLEYRRDGDCLIVEFETRSGRLQAVLVHTAEMLRNGITLPWPREPLIKELSDWRLVAELFGSLRLVPDPKSYRQARDRVGEDGVVVSGASEAGSPMHHIQKTFFPGSEFFLLYAERRAELEAFAEALSPFYEQLLDFYRTADVDGVMWGANYDDTITYPPYFEEQILPWWRRASEVLRPRNIPLVVHCDGENRRLMELIRTSGIDAAESICPYPMTALTLQEYYGHWAGDLCIIGGIPAEYLVPEQTSLEDFSDYLRYVLHAVAPGGRFIAGITDAVPPTADFDRLRRAHEYFERQAGLPLAGGPSPPIFSERQAEQRTKTAVVTADYARVAEAVLSGEDRQVVTGCRDLLDIGLPAEEVLQNGLMRAMDVLGERFAAGEAFIPEMLLGARAMQAGVDTLQEALAATGGRPRSPGKVVLGTVKGDLHDIGKNLVAIMLRGVGFEVIDLGTDVAAEDLVAEVLRTRPQVLALSALLTTTLPQMGEVISALEEAGLRDEVKVIVGGAPVTEQFARQIHADGYGESAGTAASVARELLGA